MLNAGVMGFKCFLIHSGVDEFPHVDRSDLEQAFPILQGTSAVVLVCKNMMSTFDQNKILFFTKKYRQ